jgi:hypothetical protein
MSEEFAASFSSVMQVCLRRLGDEVSFVLPLGMAPALPRPLFSINLLSRIKPAVEGRGSVRNDPAAERNFLSSVQCAGRRHVGELAHGVGDAVPDRLTTVIVPRRKFIGARGAFLDGLRHIA